MSIENENQCQDCGLYFETPLIDVNIAIDGTEYTLSLCEACLERLKENPFSILRRGLVFIKIENDKKFAAMQKKRNKKSKARA